MKKSHVIKNETSGIKWYKHVLTEFKVEDILKLTVENHKQFPNTWRGGWSNVHWAFHNAFRSLYDKMKVKIRNNGQSAFNLDEVLNQEQIDFLSKECGVPLPFIESWKRD